MPLPIYLMCLVGVVVFDILFWLAFASFPNSFVHNTLQPNVDHVFKAFVDVFNAFVVRFGLDAIRSRSAMQFERVKQHREQSQRKTS